ncbi:MAG: hypothetical protein MN733_09730, partial [Nitrososphaera sp.]|nr:hypothetical protein [Nitrososphaera sp.]
MGANLWRLSDDFVPLRRLNWYLCRNSGDHRVYSIGLRECRGARRLTPEGKVKAEIKAGLKALGSDCHFFMPVQTGYGRRAVDFIGCYRRRF